MSMQEWAHSLLLELVPPVRQVLDGPRCLLEKKGFASPSRSRYSPAAGGTIDGLRCTPAGVPQLDGGLLGDSLVVVSGLGGVVQRVARDGREMWRAALTQPRGLQVAGPYVLVGSGDTILWLNKHDGRLVAETSFDWPVTGFSLHGRMLAVALRVKGRGAVRVYELQQFEARELCRIEDQLSYPRGVCLAGESLYIADTFGHRILMYKGRSGRFAGIAASAASFYPNSVRLHDGKLLVAEEHINQVAGFDPVHLARLPPLAACWSSGGAVTPLEKLVARVNERAIDGESVCKVRTRIGTELLAPNDSVQSQAALYVADTDNHRIVMYKAGVARAVLANFNEPVNVDIVS